MSWENRLVIYVGHLIDDNKQSQTIMSYISTIRSVLMENGIQLNEDKYLLSSLTRACRLNNDQVFHHFPTHKGMLRLLLKELDAFLLQERNQCYLNSLYKALLVTTYYGLFRIGEVTRSQHTVLAKNVHIGTKKDKMLFVLDSPKTHNKGCFPQTIKITASMSNSKSTAKDFCPFSLLREYIARHPTQKYDKEQFFVLSDRSPVTPQQFRSLLKQTLRRVHFVDDRYSVHRLRAGRALDLLNAGISIETIKKLFRWKLA